MIEWARKEADDRSGESPWLSQFIGDQDYAKREYDVPKMTEALAKGKKLIEALSTELGQ